MRYVLGLDIGIGYIGWAVINCDEPRRIVDFGVRAFESGELDGGKDRTSQQRRRYRAARRLVRRRSHRKHRIKAHLDNIGLVSIDKIEDYFRSAGTDIISLRVKGLDEKLTPEEIAACMINYCNKRGYQDFYEMDESDMSAQEKKEYLSERAGAEFIDCKMSEGNYRTIAEMIKNDPYFEGTGAYRSYRNSAWREEVLQINRKYLRDECAMLLDKQREYYPAQLTEQNIGTILKIIFDQRCFEDGPGSPDDKFRRYTSFLDTYGHCRFYPEEERGCRFTVLADIYSLVNVLSQYKYLDANNEEMFSGALAADMINFALQNGNIGIKDVKKLAKAHGITVNTNTMEKKDDISRCLKYIKVLKPIFDSCGIDWQTVISEDYCDMDSTLNKLGVLLAENQTPRRRIERLEKLNMFDEKTISRLAVQKFSGTSNVSNKYMLGAIDAFLQGDIYGKHQANIIKKLESERTASGNASIKLPSFESKKNEFEFYKNPVVCRSINETRKIINAVIGKYGSPYAINIEVASELNRSFADRQDIERSQKQNLKNRDRVKAEIAAELGIDIGAVSARQVDCYILGEQQEWKCLYSGVEINKKACLDPKNRTYEIDHIIPYSIILDNTLHNKALVYASENQTKKQRTPLMYLSGKSAEEYRGRVRAMFYSKPSKISQKKFDYLMQESLDGEIIGEWKSRNINDTRYISKFLVRYLRENLVFNHEQDEPYRQAEVYAVKGAVTSQMRRLWLNEKTWGNSDKKELKKITLLDHAADAVVIACCIPAYVEIASVQNKLRNIYKRAGKHETDEYKAVMEDCITNMIKFHGMRRETVTALLRNKDRTPCLIEKLREEVDIRFIEPNTFREFAQTDEEKNMTDEEIYAIYRIKCREQYPDDAAFADSLQPVIVSHKPNRKARGTISKDNALSVRTIDGEEWVLSRTSILGLKKKQLSSIYSGDEEMLHMLEELMTPMKDDATVQEALNACGQNYFITPSGRRINKVTLKSKPQGRKLIKHLADGGVTVLNSTSYYCVELYFDSKEKVRMRGITYGELVRKDGKLWLSADSKLPENYSKHYMYLFSWDYIKILNDKGEIKFSGYFVSAKNVNRSLIRRAGDATVTMEDSPISIAQKDRVHKYEIDVLGKMGGEIECGEPLSSITERS